MTGPAAAADGPSLRAVLDRAGLAEVPARLSAVLGGTEDLPAGGTG